MLLLRLGVEWAEAQQQRRNPNRSRSDFHFPVEPGSFWKVAVNCQEFTLRELKQNVYIGNLVDWMAILCRRFETDLLCYPLRLFIEAVPQPIDHPQHLDLSVGAKLDLERDLALNLKLSRLFRILRPRFRDHLGGDKIHFLRLGCRRSAAANCVVSEASRSYRDTRGARSARRSAHHSVREASRGNGPAAGSTRYPIGYAGAESGGLHHAWSSGSCALFCPRRCVET